MFLVVFLTLYSSLHFYAFLKVRAAFSLGIMAQAVLVVFMILMIISPVIIRISERVGMESMARFFAFAGYIWMGLLFLFITAAIILDIYRLIAYAAGSVLGAPVSHWGLSPRYLFFIALGLSVAIAAYGYFEALDIRTTRITLRSHKIPKDIGRLTIAQISDVHIGLIVREKRVKRILEKVKEANPDILVSTGDLVDGQLDNIKGLGQLFRSINPRLGSFAITGNHEFYAGLARSIDFTKEVGFNLLRGEGVTVNGLINIAGVDDPAGKRFGLMKEVPEEALLSGFPQDRFTLLLKHRPVIVEGAKGLFDLQLSGHTHKGQIFPFSLITRIFHPALAGMFPVAQNALLYVSRGSGTWGPPIRFLVPPEVVIVELVHQRRE